MYTELVCFDQFSRGCLPCVYFVETEILGFYENLIVVSGYGVQQWAMLP